MKMTMAIALIGLLIAGCSQPTQEVIVVTATAPLETAIPTSTNTPTPTPLPSSTPRPTATLVPTWEPIALAEFESALRDDGYRRFPIAGEDGLNGFTWVKNNSYERVRTWEDGTIVLEVLLDKSAAARSDRMERKFAVLDTVFPTGFMVKLREEHTAYNRSVGQSVSGDPDEMYVYNDEWRTIWGEYNAVDTDFGGYGVRFSLWWWQSTCPPQYSYCFYYDFPGLESTGDSSFTFYTVTIWLPDTGLLGRLTS